jgi:hypothetical protein
MVEGQLRQQVMFVILSVLLNAALSWLGFRGTVSITGIAIATPVRAPW